jgi:hypothetical protein
MSINPTHPIDIACGRKPEYPEKKNMTFGRVLPDSFHNEMKGSLCTAVNSPVINGRIYGCTQAR